MKLNLILFYFTGCFLAFVAGSLLRPAPVIVTQPVPGPPVGIFDGSIALCRDGAWIKGYDRDKIPDHPQVMSGEPPVSIHCFSDSYATEIRCPDSVLTVGPGEIRRLTTVPCSANVAGNGNTVSKNCDGKP